MIEDTQALIKKYKKKLKITPTVTLVYVNVVLGLVVSIVINICLQDVNMRMSITTFAKHIETNKVNYFTTKTLHCGQTTFL